MWPYNRLKPIFNLTNIVLIALLVFGTAQTAISDENRCGDNTGDNTGHTTCSCGSPDTRPYPVNCAAHDDNLEQGYMCVYGHHCSCTEGFRCPSLSDPTETVIGGECAPGFVCSPKCTNQNCNCGNSSSNPGPVDCMAHGDVGAFCVYGDHCSCSDGFQCDSFTDKAVRVKGGECQPGSRCVPVPPILSMSKPTIGGESAKKAKRFLKKVTDGKLTTEGKTSTTTDPWFSTKVNYYLLVSQLVITVIPPLKKRNRKKLVGLEIWAGNNNNQRLLKCGGPYKMRDIKKGAITTLSCSTNNKLNYKYVTLYIKGESKKLQIAGLSVTSYYSITPRFLKIRTTT